MNKPLRYNSFVNSWKLLLLCKKLGAIALPLLGLMAGRQVCRQAGRQAARQNRAKF